jgi:hypothetical protein
MNSHHVPFLISAALLFDSADTVLFPPCGPEPSGAGFWLLSRGASSTKRFRTLSQLSHVVPLAVKLKNPRTFRREGLQLKRFGKLCSNAHRCSVEHKPKTDRVVFLPRAIEGKSGLSFFNFSCYRRWSSDE